jgi:hypothetical protein
LDVLHLSPEDDAHDCSIFEASFFQGSESFYWADTSDVTEEDIANYNGT